MIITPEQSKIYNITSPKEYLSALGTVQVTSNGEYTTVTATDRYKLLSITNTKNINNSGSGVYHRTELLNNTKIAKISKSSIELAKDLEDIQFPKWDTLKPVLDNYKTIKVSKRYLLDLLKSIEADCIDIKFNTSPDVLSTDYKPLVLEANNIDHLYYGLLMPIRA